MWGQAQDLSLFGKGEIRATSQWRLPSQQGAAELQDAGVALQRVLSPSQCADGEVKLGYMLVVLLALKSQ